MFLSPVLLTLSVLVTLLAALPYIRDILGGDSRPNIASWSVWTILTAVATIVEFGSGETIAAIITLAATIETFSIVLLGIRYGYVAVERFDWICLAGALLGLSVWLIFDNAPFAVFITVGIDFIGALPTVRHSWRRPLEETWLTYLLGGIGGALGLLSLSSFNWTNTPYPTYIAAMNLLIVLVILGRRKAIDPLPWIKS